MSRWMSLSQTLIGSEPAAEILRLNRIFGLDDIFRIAASATSRHKGRGVCPIELKAADGSHFVTYFKLNWGRPRLWPRMSDIKTGQAMQSLVLREWRGLEQAERHGFHVPERLGLFEEGLINRRAAIIIRAVPPKYSLSELIRNKDWLQRPEEERNCLVDQAREVLQRIDAAGLAWRGASTRHIFPDRQPDGTWKMWLIDCEGIHSRNSRTKSRDLARFDRTLKTDHLKRSQKLGEPRKPEVERIAA